MKELSHPGVHEMTSGEANQVILNLVINASHTIGDVAQEGGPAKGTITISTEPVREEVEIRIADTGQGLPIAHSVIVKKHGGSPARSPLIEAGPQWRVSAFSPDRASGRVAS